MVKELGQEKAAFDTPSFKNIPSPYSVEPSKQRIAQNVSFKILF